MYIYFKERLYNHTLKAKYYKIICLSKQWQTVYCTSVCIDDLFDWETYFFLYQNT